MRVAYLDMDSAGRTGPDNPLTKPAVRQAIAMAIDRQAMVRKFMLGAARVLDAPCYPTQFGCDQGSAVPYDYDPAKARALLAEAGYPRGFGTEIVSYLLPQWGEAVQGYLQAVGIDAHLAQLSVADAVAAQRGWRQSADHGQLGQLLDQRRLRLPAVFLHRRPQRLHAGAGNRGAGATRAGR